MDEGSAGRDRLLLKNILAALNLTLSVDVVNARAPELAKLSSDLKLVLIFGQQLGKFYQRGKHDPIKFGELTSVNHSVICCTYSLADMLFQPLLKRKVWLHLQTVIKYLATHGD